MRKTPKPRDPHWKMRRAMGHKVIPSRKRYNRKKMEKVTPRNATGAFSLAA